jgi:heavy metal translocating P-type ATPase
LAEEHVTGEAAPAVKRPGDEVFAGAHVVDSTLVIETTHASGDRLIDGIVASVERAWRRPSKYQKEADRVVAWFFPVVAAATLMTFAGWAWFVDVRTGLLHSLAVLLVACPCALGFAVPLAVWQTLGRFASGGLVADGGDVVERLAAVDTAVFDKTGTLTKTSDRLIDLVTHPDSGLKRADVLQLASAVEATTQHPLANAFRAEVASDAVVESTRLIPGRGVEGVVRTGNLSRTVFVGLPDDTDARLPSLRRASRREPGAHEIVIVIDGETVGLAAIDETPHAALAETRQALEELGIRSILATGDREIRANRLGFDVVYAQQKPEDKRVLVESLRAEGRRVLFIGDGVNDAAGMAEADVGIAASSGAELATDVADLVWFGRDPLVIPDAIERARTSVRTIRENLAWAAAYNLVGMSVAAAGLLHPVFAAVLMVGSSLFVTLRTTIQTGDSLADEVKSADGLGARPQPARAS